MNSASAWWHHPGPSALDSDPDVWTHPYHRRRRVWRYVCTTCVYVCVCIYSIYIIKLCMYIYIFIILQTSMAGRHSLWFWCGISRRLLPSVSQATFLKPTQSNPLSTAPSPDPQRQEPGKSWGLHSVQGVNGWLVVEVVVKVWKFNDPKTAPRPQAHQAWKSIHHWLIRTTKQKGMPWLPDLSVW